MATEALTAMERPSNQSSAATVPTRATVPALPTAIVPVSATVPALHVDVPNAPGGGERRTMSPLFLLQQHHQAQQLQLQQQLLQMQLQQQHGSPSPPQQLFLALFS
eukprot:TRINITY_DN94_c0_g1_i1.p1 TRINITY_DN94_c0_g1~~TRINITY_DN94_c0_g1_i1.p1  ORF type:complete len:106 (+),score=27.38 TRINITY_DN94_c0_g1_i1:131-448(+)